MTIPAETPRAKRVVGLFDFSEGHGLEIGPLDKPLVPRSSADVAYADIYPREQLAAAHDSSPQVKGENIPEIDYPLWDGSTMRTVAEAAKAGAPFDWVFASHVVEHVPDLVGWLQQIASLVVDDGALVLVVPDRRYCFDAHRPPTTVGQMLQAYESGDLVPSVRAVYDHHRSAISAPAPALWRGRIPSYDARIHDLEFVKSQVRRAQQGEYVDCHVWTFTDTSFTEVIDELRALGHIDWHVAEIAPVPKNELEFYVVLRRGEPTSEQSADAFPDWLTVVRDQRETNAALRARVRQQRKTIRNQRTRVHDLQRELAALRGSLRWRAASKLAAPVRVLRRRG